MQSLRLVDGLDESADVLVDLTNADRGIYLARDGLDLGTPGLLGTAGGGVDVGYDYRQMQVMLRIVNDDRTAALRAQATIARVLLRDNVCLRYQVDPESAPVWFRLYRTTPSALSLTRAGNDVWDLTIPLVADPFAYGEEVAFTLNVSNDPTVGSVALELPSIFGDAPAPLVVSGIDQDDGGLLHLPLVAVTPLSSWPGLQRFKPAFSDAAWAMNAEAVSLADTEASSGRTVKSLVSNAVTLSISGAVTPAQAGTYRLFARLRGTTLDTTLTFGGTAAQVTTTATGLALSRYVNLDMGLYTFPKGNAPLEAGYTLASAGDTAHPEVSITATMPSGFTTVYVDDIVAVPCELFESVAPSSLLMLTRSGLLGNRINGEVERVGPMPGEVLQPQTPEAPIGGYPTVVPGAANVLHFLTKVYTDDTISAFNPAETFGAVATLQLSYRPQYLHLASD